MPVTIDVALLHDGRVLLEDGVLPRVTIDEDEDHRFRAVLDRVGADVYLAPALRVGRQHGLDVVGCRRRPVPVGAWVDPSELPEHADLVVRTVGEVERPPELRPAWFRPGWYDAVEAWVDSSLAGSGRRRSGEMQVDRVWSISAVLRIPTDHGWVWFKAAGGPFRNEASVHVALASHFPDDVPVLLAADEVRGWLLMESLAGAADRERAAGAADALAHRWPQVQLDALGLRGALVDAGLPVRDARATIAGLRAVLTSDPDGAGMGALTPAEQAAVADVEEEVVDLVEEFWDCGLPDTLAHGDLHLGNVAFDGGTLRVFDWTDGCLTHPLLDGIHLSRFDDEDIQDDRVLATFAAPWREAYPAARIDRALQLALVVDIAFQVDTFARIAAATEPASAYELGRVLPWLLRRLPLAVAEVRGAAPARGPGQG